MFMGEEKKYLNIGFIIVLIGLGSLALISILSAGYPSRRAVSYRRF